MITLTLTINGLELDVTQLQSAVRGWVQREGPGLAAVGGEAVEALRAAERDPGVGTIAAAVEAVEVAAAAAVEAVAPQLRRRGQ